MNRYLGISELGFYRLSSTMTMNPVVLARYGGRLPLERLRRALDRVQERHPPLRVRIVPGDRPWFTDSGVPPIPLEVLERRSHDHFLEVVEDQLNEPIDVERGPLARFVLLQGEDVSELVCVTEHVNADGRSGLFLLNDVLRLVDDPELRLPPLVERPPLEDLVPPPWWAPQLPRPLRGIVGDQSSRWWAALERVARRWWPEQPQGESTRSRIGVMRRLLEPDVVERLTVASHEARTSLQGALMAAATMAAVAERAPERQELYGCIVPIDIRDRLRPRMGSDFGIYAWAPTCFLEAGPRTGFWRLARRSGRAVRQLRGPVGMGFLASALSMGQMFGEVALADRFNRWAQGRVRGLVVVSNLGIVELPERCAGAELLSFSFMAMIPNVDVVMGVSSCRGSMELTFQYVPGQLDEEETGRVADTVVRRLREAAGLSG
jgi:NRPS condensation-like uncharacterized protein